MNERRNNYRLERIAEQICSRVMTDGFCGPRNRPDCRCWTAARAALQGLENQSYPCLKAAWPEMASDDARQSHLEALCKAIRDQRDELTAEHAASQSPDQHKER